MFVSDISYHIRCELHDAVTNIINRSAQPVPWLNDWSAEVSLTLTINEKTLLGPNLGLVDTVFQSATQTIGLGLAGNFNQTSTRVVEITLYEVFADLLKEKFRENCDPPGRTQLLGNLKLEESLRAGIYPATQPHATSNPFVAGGPLKEIQSTTTFDVDVGGSATPTFKFTHVSGNTSGAFLNMDRDRKDQLLITMGPAALPEAKRKLVKQPASPTSFLEQSHNIGRFGLSVQRYLTP